MNWLEIKNSVNEWIWDNVSKLYLKVLSTDEDTKIIKAQVSCGLENELLYENGRFYRYEQIIGRKTLVLRFLNVI